MDAARPSDRSVTVASTKRVYAPEDPGTKGVVVTRLSDGSDYVAVYASIEGQPDACSASFVKKVGSGRPAQPEGLSN